MKLVQKFKGFIKAGSFFGLLLFLSPLSYGVPRYDYEFTERGHYEAESAAKMGRGLSNVLLGWTEVIR